MPNANFYNSSSNQPVGIKSLNFIFEQSNGLEFQFSKPIRYTITAICLILIAIYIIKYILYKRSVKKANVDNEEATKEKKKEYKKPSIGYIIVAVVLYANMIMAPWIFAKPIIYIYPEEEMDLLL